MAVETYCKVSVEELNAYMDSLESKSSGDKSRQQLCAELGLLHQRARKPIEKALLYFPQMSTLELYVWGSFLPTCYSKKEGEWTQYAFDTIPLESLECISRTRMLAIFDDLEIWTPEYRSTDPLVVGVVGERGEGSSARRRTLVFQGGTAFFPITRWGESLQPVDTIAREIMLQFITNETQLVIPEQVFDQMRRVWENNPRVLYYSGQNQKSPCPQCKGPLYEFHNYGTDRSHTVWTVCQSCSFNQQAMRPKNPGSRFLT